MVGVGVGVGVGVETHQERPDHVSGYGRDGEAHHDDSSHQQASGYGDGHGDGEAQPEDQAAGLRVRGWG